MKKKTILVGMLSCCLALTTIKVAQHSGVSAHAGWQATKSLGGGEGAQWAVAGSVGYLGGYAGAWAGAQAGAAIGVWAGPWGAVIGGAIGAGVGAW